MPKYFSQRSALRDRILAEQLRHYQLWDETLPCTEESLMDYYGMSRATVKKALASLCRGKWMRRYYEHGKWHYILDTDSW